MPVVQRIEHLVAVQAVEGSIPFGHAKWRVRIVAIVRVSKTRGSNPYAGSNPAPSAMILEFSAGGIVFKKEKGKAYILVSQHSGHHGWVFPKGRIGDHVENEGRKETALREVKEEVGVEGKILKQLKPITYFYKWERKTIKKTVYYFLMEYVSGDINDHDWEMENVEWLPIDEVGKRLSYPSDKKVWKEARELI